MAQQKSKPNYLNNVKRAVVTGASGGLGAALAERLAARGIEVWLVARRAAELDALVAKLHAKGQAAHALVLDVGDADAVYERFARLDAETGGIDLVIANAAVAGARAAETVSKAQWQDVRAIFDVNLIGAAATILPFVAGMRQRGHGQIVGISSIAAEFPSTRVFAYGASKAGLTFMLTCLDMDLRRRGIPVTIVHPGFVRTPASDTLPGPLPFLVETETAIDIIERGIQRGTRIVRFPRAFFAMLHSMKLLPKGLRKQVMRRSATAA